MPQVSEILRAPRRPLEGDEVGERHDAYCELGRFADDRTLEELASRHGEVHGQSPDDAVGNAGVVERTSHVPDEHPRRLAQNRPS